MAVTHELKGDKMNTIGERLQEAMLMRGIKASDLAKRSGLSRGHVSNLIKDRIKHPRKNLSDICRILNISELWLTYGVHENDVNNIQSYNVFSIVESELRIVGVWLSDLKMSDSNYIYILDCDDNINVLSKNELGEGAYLFIKDKGFFRSFRTEDLHGIKWSNIEFIDSSYKLLGKVIGLIPRSFVQYKKL
ncbi:helix-turn-helix domain-containing protein [Photobacterium leiognathi]|uniref:helix-turn-helix domain-containing protein n=1 Tax=Photobacterium leiognathi TaxID=553611 RepID=UPI002738BBDC|nr:helix-turn-helix transcriptional regulator [Photobacterium leiognathi]